MNAASIIETLNVPPAVSRPTAPAQVSDQPPQSFKQSLLAASKTASDGGGPHEGFSNVGRLQSHEGGNPKLPIVMPHVRAVLSAVPSQHAGHQQVLLAQQPPLIDLIVTPMQQPLVGSLLSQELATIGSGQALHDAQLLGSSQIESNIGQTTVAEHRPSNAISNPIPSVVKDAVPGVTPNVGKLAVPNPASSVFPSFVPGPNPIVAPTGLSGDVPIVNPKAIPAEVAALVQDPKQTLSSIPGAVAKAGPAATASTTQRAAPEVVASPAQDSTIPVVPHGIAAAALNAEPSPAVHATLNDPAKGELAQSSSPGSTGQASTTESDPIGSTVLILPGATADQLVAQFQPGGALLAPARASLSSAAVAKPAAIAGVNGINVTGNAINNPAGTKQHAQSLAQTQSQTGSQDAALARDQSQGGASQQGQSAAPVPLSFASHIAAPIDHAPSPGVTTPLQNSPALAPIAAHTPKAPDTTASAALPLPPALPVINTARLIQSMGQSEMRVGMRSSDFGNISISTSATKGLISAQISLDHSELARTLAVHLPEMQAKLGSGNQAMNVRIDLTGHATGTSAGMSNGSGEGSRDNRQQKGSPSSNHPGNRFVGQGNSIAVAAVSTGEARLNARLDITA